MKIERIEWKAIAVFIAFGLAWFYMVGELSAQIASLNPILSYFILNAAWFIMLGLAAWVFTKYVLSQRSRFNFNAFKQTVLSMFTIGFLWDMYGGSFILGMDNTFKVSYLSVIQSDYLIAYIGKELFPWLATTFWFGYGALFVWTYFLAPLICVIIIAHFADKKRFISLFPVLKVKK